MKRERAIARESSLTEAERARFPGLDVFAGYAAASGPETELFFVTVHDCGSLVAVAPVVRLDRRRVTDLTRGRWWRRLGCVCGPLVRRTILLLDTAFRAYDAAPPILCLEEERAEEVHQEILGFLSAEEGVDAIWIAEPRSGARFVDDESFDSFMTLPMVHVRTEGVSSLDGYVHRLSKKRRRNFRVERQAFAAAGAEVVEVESPLDPDTTEAALRCLQESARRSTFHVPYTRLLNDADTFARQRQTVLLARIGQEVIGFFSLAQRGTTLLQTHGGMDYARSIDARAYHNLTYAAIELAIRRGCARLSLGPLNNETKRRCGTDLVPMVASLWCRKRVDRFLMDRFLIRRLQVYTGEVQ